MFENKCRICLVDLNSSIIRVDLFEERNMHLTRQIRSITGIQIKKINGQPQQMCNKCLMDLGCAIKFRQRCIISQKRFKEEDPDEPEEKGFIVKENFEETLDFIEEVHDEDDDSQIDYYFTSDEDSQSDIVDQPDIIEFEVQNEIEAQDEGSIKKVRVKFSGPFVCEECGKSLSNLYNFREHQLRHSGIKSFMCKHCRKPFTTHKELMRHIRRHTGERPYICRYCPSKFTDLNTAQQHERRHTNTRPFECSECGKSFFSSSCLSKHRFIHKSRSIPRTQHCKICDVWFHRSTHLNAHKNSRAHRLKEHAAKLSSLLSD